MAPLYEDLVSDLIEVNQTSLDTLLTLCICHLFLITGCVVTAVHSLFSFVFVFATSTT